MTLLSVLKLEWTFLGLKAPWFAWAGAAVLLVVTLVILASLAFRVFRERRIHERLRRGLDKIQLEHPKRPGEGLSLAGYDAIARVFEDAPSLRVPWEGLNAQILRQQNASAGDEYWISESAGAAFSEASVIDSRLNRSFYAAVPGVVTAVGLLLTFVAILVALFDIRIENNQVVGLENLIAGLSGKFVSSVTALASASIFLVFEKPLLHGLAKSRLRVVATIDGLIPRRTPSQILADLHRDLAEQSTAFRSFNSDLSLKLRQSFSESMGPTLERMVRTIDDLNQFMRAGEAQKQESIAGSVEALLRNLEQSITGALREMGERFSAALSGNTQQQFDELARSLGGTARLLQDMNAQAQATQTALGDLVSLAKIATTEQMMLGKKQIEDLTSMVQQLMSQVNQAAGASVAEMAATLTGVVSDLSTKVGQLGEQMTQSIVQTTNHASGAATFVIKQADEWSAKTAEQFARLLERHQAHVEQIEIVNGALNATLSHFRQGIQQYTAVTADLQKVSAELGAVAMHTAETTKTMRGVQEALQHVSTLSATQIDQLATANRKQEDTWRQIQDSMRQYQQIFSHVDKAAGDLLVQLSQHSRNYTDMTREGFANLVKVSDELMRNAVQRLSASIDELEEYLQDLTELLGKARAGL